LPSASDHISSTSIPNPHECEIPRSFKINHTNAQILYTHLKCNHSNKEQTAFPFELDARSKDNDTDDDDTLDHIMTFDVMNIDNRLRVMNHLTKYDMSDTPKLKNAIAPGHPMREEWMGGVLAELLGLELNKILQPIALDQLTIDERKHLLPSQIILKLKRSNDANRTPLRAKARWVVGGHRAKRDWHYTESASRGCMPSSIRILLAKGAAQRKLIMATDIQQAFTSAPLDPKIKNRICIRLPKVLEFRDDRNVPVVMMLLSNTYGLPNSGYQFAVELDAHLAKLGFEPSSGDHNLHRRVNEKGEWQYYAGYIDDGSGLFSENEEYTSS